jgi:hypothetical protein
MKMAAFCIVAPCSLVDVSRRFRGACCLRYQVIALMMEAAGTSETSVNFYQTTQRYNPEDSHLRSVLSKTFSPFSIFFMRFKMPLAFIH